MRKNKIQHYDEWMDKMMNPGKYSDQYSTIANSLMTNYAKIDEKMSWIHKIWIERKGE